MFKRRMHHFASNKVTLLLIIMAVTVAFFYCVNPGYLDKGNLLILLKSTSIAGVIAIGVGVLLISGQVDLSTGAVASLSGVLVALLLSYGVPWPLAVVSALLFGAAAGAVAAFLVNQFGMMSFIATIGLSSVWQGIAYALTRNGAVKFMDEGFLSIGSIAFFNSILPLVYVIMLVLMVLYGFLLSQTVFGRSVYICGGSRNAARLAGINPKKVNTILFMNSGMLAALAGVLLTANMRKGDSAALSQGMTAVTASILGGVGFSGGTGGIGGIFVGLMLLSFFNSGLAVVRLKSFWQIFAQGMLLIFALLFDYYRENRRMKTQNKTGAL